MAVSFNCMCNMRLSATNVKNMLFSFTAVMAILAFKKEAVAAARGFSLEPIYFPHVWSFTSF